MIDEEGYCRCAYDICNEIIDPDEVGSVETSTGRYYCDEICYERDVIEHTAKVPTWQ